MHKLQICVLSAMRTKGYPLHTFGPYKYDNTLTIPTFIKKLDSMACLSS